MRINIRNPFAIRSSEKIDSESFFLKLFSHFALENLADQAKKDNLWDKLYFIRSSPGAGKTSLLKLFQPSYLHNLSRSQNIYKDLYNILKGMDAINDDGINVIGVLLSIRDYETIDDVNIIDSQKSRIFNALVNARLTIALLKAISDFYLLQFPEDLKNIEYNNKNLNLFFFKGINFPCTGKDLYNWAVNIEIQIAQALDSFNANDILGKEGHEELFAFACYQPSFFKVNNKEIKARFLFMLDDVHSLAHNQRRNLKQYLMTRRLLVSVWLAERLSALSPIETLTNQEERDYNVINIENYWSSRPKAFKKLISNIAENRATLSADGVETFGNFLEEQDQYLESFASSHIYESELTLLSDLAKYHSKYNSWFKYAADIEGTFYKKALACRHINILIHRDLSKNIPLDIDSSVSEISQKVQQSSDLKPVAALFIANEYKLPYYAGFDNLVNISNQNIQQFLGFATPIFERILSQRLTNLNDPLLKITDQQKILKQSALENWKNLPRLVNKSIVSFLQEFARTAVRETYRPSSPYSPGVTGFAVTPSRRLSLFTDSNDWLNDPVYQPLIKVLSECVAYNLLLPFETSQGKKNERHTVYYLNRWLCIVFDLPLGYGGWRHRKPSELIKMIK